MRVGVPFVVAALVAVGCVRPGAVTCENGNVCPAGLRCDPRTEPEPDAGDAQCVSDQQLTVCIDSALIDGDRCEAGEFSGICDQGVCVSGCGDGVLENEECDDGNLKSHDGCSSRCVVEQPSWRRLRSTWSTRTGHVAGYHAAANKLVVVGGTDQNTALKDMWELTQSQAGVGAPWIDRWDPRPMPMEFTGRFGASMAYDEQRARLVLFGGTNDPLGRTALADAWVFDGSAWTALTSSTPGPEARYDAAMAYVGGGRIVLFGGRNGTNEYLGDTWELDGTTWREITGGAQPPGRFGATMAWAPFTLEPRAVMVGGYGLTNIDPMTSGYLLDHWEYIDGGWRERTAPAALSLLRRFGSLAFSAREQRLVLAGGALNQISRLDAWTFDGSTWAPLPGSSANPPARSGATLTPTRSGDLYLVGGASDVAALDDTWAYVDRSGVDGGGVTSWRERPSPARTRRQSYHALVHDPDRDVTISFGGFGGNDETYELDGTLWRRVLRTENTPRIRASAVYDARRRRVVAFGGNRTDCPSSPIPCSSTLFYEEGAWSEPALPQPLPASRRYAPMAYDERTEQIVMFGGQALPGLELLGDTWIFDTEWRQAPTSGQPAPSEQAGIAYDARRQRVVLYDQAGETWSFSKAGWTRLAFQPEYSGPGPRVAPGFAYSRDLGDIILFGGINADGIQRDMYRLTDLGWEPIELPGELPLPRNDVHLVDHPPLRSLILHAGRTVSDQNLDDTWLFQFVSATPDEDCLMAGDEDDDKRFDADDPDCQ